MIILHEQWGYMFRTWGKWMNTTPWFWPSYGMACISPAFFFIIYLIWWLHQPDTDDEVSNKCRWNLKSLHKFIYTTAHP